MSNVPSSNFLGDRRQFRRRVKKAEVLVILRGYGSLISQPFLGQHKSLKTVANSPFRTQVKDADPLTTLALL